MSYIIMACLTLLISCTASFVAYNNKSWGIRDDEDLVVALGMSFLCSLMWFVALPAIVFVGGAWLLAKVISKPSKEKK